MEHLLDFHPFIQEHEDFTATLGITALLEDRGTFLIVDYPMSGEFEGYKFVNLAKNDYELVARAWLCLTGHAAPNLGESAA